MGAAFMSAGGGVSVTLFMWRREEALRKELRAEIEKIDTSAQNARTVEECRRLISEHRRYVDGRFDREERARNAMESRFGDALHRKSDDLARELREFKQAMDKAIELLRANVQKAIVAIATLTGRTRK
ncbi:MAG: hypothetical protein AAF360_13775 [Pseudomonadota bacterium]